MSYRISESHSGGYVEFYRLGYNAVQSCHQLHACFLLGLFFDAEDGGDVPPKRRLTINGLHGVMSQKIELFGKCLIPHEGRDFTEMNYNIHAPHGPRSERY
jgi:hypothetical protein